jgi:uncharacterized protein (TIGR03790 family)
MSDRRQIYTVLLFGFLTLSPPIVWGGGGPENVFLVVNSRSWASRTIANHYCQLRAVPESNVFQLDWTGSNQKIGVDRFRDEILRPIVSQIEKRGLAGQIDHVVYSADFPYQIALDADLKDKKAKFAVGSITGLTYLYPWVLAEDIRYSGLNVNWYASVDKQGNAESRGFSNRSMLGANGQRVTKAGQHYMLSTMLAFTSGRGNSVDEAIQYLQRSALADGTHPAGTIYFMRNDNVRSTVRHHLFDGIAKKLEELGVRAQVLDGNFPDGKTDIAGATVGRARHPLNNRSTTILPGAICDNFTSFGGVFNWHVTQTALTDFLRLGAAGASGTVVEPYAVLNKFPHPMIHVHYVRGCTLAESFYQSVPGPLQLLIVGDPLCRPWASIPKVRTRQRRLPAEVSGEVSLTPVGGAGSLQPIARYELFIDGRFVGSSPPGGQFTLHTKEIIDGYHEFRIVAVDQSPLEQRGRRIFTTVTNNHDLDLQVELLTPSKVTANQRIQLSASCPGAAKMVVTSQRRTLATIDGERGSTSVLAGALGEGPVSLQVIAIVDVPQTEGADGDRARAAATLPLRVISRPLNLDVLPRPPIMASVGATVPAASIQLTKQDGSMATITDTINAGWLKTAGVGQGERFILETGFVAKQLGTHQFQLFGAGKFDLFVNGKRVASESLAQSEQVYVPVVLSGGNHKLRIEGKVTHPQEFRAEFGMQGTRPLESSRR